jgi:DNA (cytosine-5)-methyltransferase 1
MNELYITNFKPKYTYLMGVQDFYKLDNIPEELYNIDILDGSPPCSTFSTNGRREKDWGKQKKFREGQASQVLDDLFFDFIKVANKLKPKVIIAENVKGIISGNAKGYVNAIIKELNNIGYDTQIFLLNAATMGVPQRRERVFFISRRKDLKLPELKLSFNEKPILYKEIKEKKYKPFNKETLEYKRWLKRTDKDLSIGDIVKRTENGKISCFSHKIIKDNQVPLTLTAGDPFIRYDRPGYISDKDTLTIQTFPQDYNFLDQQVQYVCGMSVPPIMMQKVAEQVYIQLFKKGEI